MVELRHTAVTLLAVLRPHRSSNQTPSAERRVVELILFDQLNDRLEPTVTRALLFARILLDSTDRDWTG